GGQPAWSYRVLMFGWALYTPALALGGYLWQRWSKNGSPAPQAIAFWVCTAGILTTCLGLKAVITHHDHLWSAGAIFLVGVAGAAMAVWRGREGWAFAAGLAVNRAASLVVWHIHWNRPAADWWVYLLQANVLATALVGALWLGARRLLYEQREVNLS